MSTIKRTGAPGVSVGQPAPSGATPRRRASAKTPSRLMLEERQRLDGRQRLDERQRSQEQRFAKAAERGFADKTPVGRSGGDKVQGYALLELLARSPSPFSPRKTYDLGGKALGGDALERMRQDWLLLVMKRLMTSKAFRKKHHLDKPTLNALRRDWPDEFNWRLRRPEKVFSPSIIKAAVRLIESYHVEEMTYLELKAELKKLGIPDTQHTNLEKQLPGGLKLARRAASVYQEQRRTYFNGMADAIEALLGKHDWVVRKQTDLLDILNGDADFKKRFPPKTRDGRYNLAWLNKTEKYDKQEADGRIEELFERVKPEGKRGRPQPTGLAGARAAREADEVKGARAGNAIRGPTKSEASSGSSSGSSGASMSLREQHKALAALLAGKTPSEAELRKAIGAFSKKFGIDRSYRLWRLTMEKHKGVVPEFARWRVGTKNDITLRYLASWVVAMKEAGPAASPEQVAKAFEKTAAFKEDGRIPDAKVFSQIKNNTDLGWDISSVNRGKFQWVRNILEAIRTGPKDLDLKALLAKTKIEPLPPYDMALHYLRLVLNEGLFAEHLDARVVKAIKNRDSRAIIGLGEAKDPQFDAAAEPPWIPLALAEKVLAIPRVEDSPLFAHAIERLDGRLPFENSNLMVVYHRYSDVAALLDLFVRAGMSPANSTFVSTPYPFDKAFDLALDDLGIPQEKFPVYDLEKFSAAVEKGLKRMIDLYDKRKAKLGHGKPILILDDGGQAANLIREKFKAHAHKFKVVEVTAAGYRITEQLKRENLRVPFVYYSVAYSDFKRKVASEFYATRVVDRMLRTFEVTSVKPPNKKAVVVGAGPMGDFAARYLKKLGYEVSVVDKSPEIRKHLLDSGFDKKHVFADSELEKALDGKGIVLSMSGFKDVIGPQHVGAMMDGAVVLQGSSKRNDFDMKGFEKKARKKTEISRADDIPQKSFTYEFKDGPGAKSLHFLGDGWTLNHDGSLHGSPFEDVQLETALLFESAVEAAGDSTTKTGDMRVVGGDVQEEYLALWKKVKGKKR